VDTASPAELILPNHPGSVREARAFTRRVLDAAAIPPDALEQATLMVSELVTNVVLHAASVVCLRVRTGSVTRIEVEDEGGPLPEQVLAAAASASASASLEPGGLGLAIVDALATRWGTDDAGRGKVVWFELDVASH
jgi:anti-sigma regulatory factor (Ser/Thr protein kinase)